MSDYRSAVCQHGEAAIVVDYRKRLLQAAVGFFNSIVCPRFFTRNY